MSYLHFCSLRGNISHASCYFFTDFTSQQFLPFLLVCVRIPILHFNYYKSFNYLVIVSEAYDFVLCALQVYEPYEAPFGAGEAEQWELGEPHDLPALLPPVHDSIPAAVPHRECSQPNRILKYDLNKVHKFNQPEPKPDVNFLFPPQPIVRFVSWLSDPSKASWSTWRKITNPGKCLTCARS